MPRTARELLAELLDEVAEPAASSAYRKLFMTDLAVAVDGVGPLRFPVSEEQVAQLRGLGHRARFGRGTETLTDPAIRDTWEIPTALVHIEWTEAFEAVLDLLRDELGLPSHCELTAELHAMLVYEPGQFFVTHQDSEKDDAMVGTLVVTLPSVHTGGELVIEDRGKTMEYRGSAVAVSLVGFYSDCRHQVLPVTSGNRITLTYNLLLTGDTGAAAESAMASELAVCLGEHFSQPVSLPYERGEADPPTRLAYLLDHEYTARGLSWTRLKGSDADRVALLRAAAGKADCEVALALADIREIWDTSDCPDAATWGDEDSGEYVLEDLIDSMITLTHWIGSEHGEPEEITLNLSDTEVAATTASADLAPYASEYEGYMGNYGNTLDRWYRRAALVVWPRGADFANRAQTSPAWGLDEIDRLIQAGNLVTAHDAARTLATLWHARAGSRPSGALLGRALRTGRALDDADLAAALLRAFHLEQLGPDHAPSLADLAARYGDAWGADLLRDWFGSERPEVRYSSPTLTEWLSGLPSLSARLRAEGDAGTATAQHLLGLSWNLFASWVGLQLSGPSPASQDNWRRGLGGPLAGILTAAAQAESSAIFDKAVEFARSSDGQAIPLLMGALRAAETLPAGSGFGLDSLDGLDRLAACCAEQLRASLARPRRAADDWSIAPPTGCTCDLCGTLAEFLHDAKRRTFEWPLVTSGRSHVHSRLDGFGLPVSHATRRQGRPYTLVLTKTEALFTSEREARERNEADLAWLTQERKRV